MADLIQPPGQAKERASDLTVVIVFGQNAQNWADHSHWLTLRITEWNKLPRKRSSLIITLMYIPFLIGLCMVARVHA